MVSQLGLWAGRIVTLTLLYWVFATTYIFFPLELPQICLYAYCVLFAALLWINRPWAVRCFIFQLVITPIFFLFMIGGYQVERHEIGDFLLALAYLEFLVVPFLLVPIWMHLRKLSQNKTNVSPLGL